MHRKTFKEDYEFDVIKTYNGGYSVSLPHQCDDWEILGAVTTEEGGDDGYLKCPLSKELAVAQMELFCKRANEALEKLKLLK